MSLMNPTGPHQAVAGTQQFGHPQHRPNQGPCLGTKTCSDREGIPGSVCMGCLQKSLGRQRLSRKGTVKQIHRRELADRGNTQSQLQAESHVLSLQQGSSPAGSRLGRHTGTHITVTNPTVLTARDTSAGPAHNYSSQLTNSPELRWEAGDAVRSCSSSQEKAHSLQSSAASWRGVTASPRLESKRQPRHEIKAV